MLSETSPVELQCPRCGAKNQVKFRESFEPSADEYRIRPVSFRFTKLAEEHSHCCYCKKPIPDDVIVKAAASIGVPLDSRNTGFPPRD